ncbi:hypothetical protein AXG93_1162s1000 [Marchantia polymorpha subsp. ruderalis]|uniref:Uncharacterized protein n=1 Tax=Marchantia polymorpha subsp. ruderalis TaxID=1480154 RepID=A0A176WQW8_MARPO|nr:hypothetical protein AXG93_1162s1000 [Marchantia polymorpha subsp. ruderalis]
MRALRTSGHDKKTLLVRRLQLFLPRSSSRRLHSGSFAFNLPTLLSTCSKGPQKNTPLCRRLPTPETARPSQRRGGSSAAVVRLHSEHHTPSKSNASPQIYLSANARSSDLSCLLQQQPQRLQNYTPRGCDDDAAADVDARPAEQPSSRSFIRTPPATAASSAAAAEPSGAKRAKAKGGRAEQSSSEQRLLLAVLVVVVVVAVVEDLQRRTRAKDVTRDFPAYIHTPTPPHTGSSSSTSTGLALRLLLPSPPLPFTALPNAALRCPAPASGSVLGFFRFFTPRGSVPLLDGLPPPICEMSSAFALSDRSRHISEPFELLEVLRFFGGHFGVQGHFQIFGVDKSIFVCRRVEV